MRPALERALRLALAAALVSGCAGAEKLPDASPRTMRTRSLDLALVISDKTNRTVQDFRDKALGSLEGGKSLVAPLFATLPFDRVSNVLRQSFRSVTRVETVEEARAVQADLIAVLDMDAKVKYRSVLRVALWATFLGIPILLTGMQLFRVIDPLKVNLDVVLSFTDLDQEQLDVIRFKVVRKAALNPPKNIAFASEELRIGLSRALASSKVLEQMGAEKSADEVRVLAKLQAGESVSAGPRKFRSSVDRPRYRAAKRPDHYGLVIGIEKYSSVPEASYAERDAEAFRAHLGALGVPDRNIVLLKGDRAGRAAVEKYVESWLPSKAKPGSRVYFFFSGHGAPDAESGQSYLVPWDGDPKYLKNTAYPLKRLYSKLNGLKAKEVIVAMDACFSGAGGRSVLAEGTRPLVMSAKKSPIPRGKLVVFSAAGPNEVTGADDRSGHGLFTYHFLAALNKWKGKPTVKGVYNYLLPRVKNSARRKNREQTPQLSPAPLGRKGRIRFRPLK